MMRGSLKRYVVLVGLLSLGTIRSVPATEAVRVSTDADTVRGIVRDGISWTGLPGVRVYLTKDSAETWSSVAPGLRTITDDKGAFVLPHVPLGSYVVNFELRGDPTQRDLVEVGKISDRDRIWEPRFGGPCLGFCFPSPSQVIYNRSRRAEWGCQVSYPQSIEAVRQSWVGSLAEREPAGWDSLLVAHRVPRDSAGIERGLGREEVLQDAGDVVRVPTGGRDDAGVPGVPHQRPSHCYRTMGRPGHRGARP